MKSSTSTKVDTKISPVISLIMIFTFIMGFILVDKSHAHTPKSGSTVEQHLRPSSDKLVEAPVEK